MAAPNFSSERRSWFKGKDTNTTTQAALRKVNDVENTHSQFRQRVNQILGKDKPKKRVTTKEELREQLQSLSPQTLRAKAFDEHERADQNLSSYELERTTGSKKFGSQVQRFFSDFADFIGAYSGIVSLVQNAGAPYGEAAYETLSLLLSVFVKKTVNDETMSELVRSLTAAFPRLDVLMSTYPSTTLEQYVADVYVDVILFAREAAEYFTAFKIRVLNAIARPPSMGVEKIASAIKGKLAEVNNEAMILLHSRNKEILETVSRVEDGNTQLKSELEDVKRSNYKQELDLKWMKSSNDRLEVELKQVKKSNFRLELQNARLEQKLKEQVDADKEERLDKLKHALDLPGESHEWPNINVDAVNEVLCTIFPGSSDVQNSAFSHNGRTKKYLHMSRDMILKDEQFVSWYRSQVSSLLFICGQPKREARTNMQSTSSWLSPAAIFATKKIQADIQFAKTMDESLEQPDDVASHIISPIDMSNDLCIFYSCHADVYSSGTPDHDTTRPFSVIAWSLCGWKSGPLQHIEDITSRAKEVFHTRAERNERAVRDLTAMVIKLLEKDASSSATVWIVLDRLDLCDVVLRKVMSQLTHLLVCQGGPRVKILVVVDKFYEGEKWDWYDLERDIEDRVIFKDGWDQRRSEWTERLGDRSEA